MEYMEFSIIPNYVDEILVDNSVTHQRLIRKAIRYAKQNFDETLDYAFDESGECPIEMAFYDGIAIISRIIFRITRINRDRR